MHRLLLAIAVMLTLCLSLAACGRAPARAGAPPLLPTHPTATAPPDDPRDYTWLALQLRADDAMVVTSDQIDQTYLPATLPGGNPSLAFPNEASRVLRVNGETVRVYTYPSTTAANADAARVSSDGSTMCISSGSEGECAVNDSIAPPYFFKVGRLIVSYIGTHLDVARLLKRVLGPPFAGASL